MGAHRQEKLNCLVHDFIFNHFLEKSPSLNYHYPLLTRVPNWRNKLQLGWKHSQICEDIQWTISYTIYWFWTTISTHGCIDCMFQTMMYMSTICIDLSSHSHVRISCCESFIYMQPKSYPWNVDMSQMFALAFNPMCKQRWSLKVIFSIFFFSMVQATLEPSKSSILSHLNVFRSPFRH